jgi:hypothetical protein
LPPFIFVNIFLNSKLRIQNLKFLRLSSARPLASPRPSGFRKALASATHRVSHTPNSKLITRNSKLWLAPLSLVTPAASDNLLRRRDGAKISERVRKLESERAKYAHPCALIALVDLLTFLHSHLLTARLRVQTQPPNGAGTRIPRFASECDLHLAP